MIYVHPQMVTLQTLLGEVCLPIRIFQYSGGGAFGRPDDRHLAIPEVGGFTDDMCCLYAYVAAGRASSGGERPLAAVHRRGPQLAGEARASSTAPPMTSSGGSPGKQPSAMPWPS
jgi:hypothetical protein